MASVNTIEFHDIQGLVTRGFGTLPAACYLLLSIHDPQKARPWLRNLVEKIAYADISPDDHAINLAVTHHGLAALEIDPSILTNFSDEFRSGMNTPHKRHILGDEGDNAPENWLWGGPSTEPVDLLLLCYGKDETELNQLEQSLQKQMMTKGLKIIERLDAQTQIDDKEHFGFRDSIGQPYIDEFNTRKPKKPNPVPLGEFLLGYPNGYGRYTQRPLVHAEQDPLQLLKPSAESGAYHDLGFNGTYLVFRQLFQDVPGFWKTLKAFADSSDQPEEKTPKTLNEEAIRLASKMVGRWPSGTALVQSPDADNPDILDKDNFKYHATDPDGAKCPFGAHIRRTNPRDSLEPEPGSEKSMEFSNRHRLLRRGRTYGPAFDPSMDPTHFLENLEKEPAPVSRGLHFICLNANIGRQFEFVQHTWANNPNFNGLYQDPDPIIGTRSLNAEKHDQFTIQKFPSRIQLTNLPSFIKTRGGAYFFLPSRRALLFLLS